MHTCCVVLQQMTRYSIALQWIAPSYRVKGKGCHSEKNCDMKGQGLNPWSWEAPRYVNSNEEGAVDTAANQMQQASLNNTHLPRRNYNPEHHAETTGRFASKAPYPYHDGTQNVRSLSPDLRHRGATERSQAAVVRSCFQCFA